MPWTKYRPIREWGRFNTRMFKLMSKARSLRRAARPYLSPEFAQRGITIYDPLQPGFEQMILNESAAVAGENAKTESGMQKYESGWAPTMPSPEEHPLYKSTPTFVFEGKIPMTDGVDQACALIKATAARPIPQRVFVDPLPKGFLPGDFEQHVVDSILAGERFDQSLEKLPKKFDPFLFWIAQQAHWGTPVAKKNHIILSNLCRKVAFLSAAAASQNPLGEVRFDVDPPISVYFPKERSGIDNHSLVFRHVPHLALQSDMEIRPLGSDPEIQESRKQPVPDLYPISALIDLEQTNVYNDTPLIPRHIIPSLHLNTLLWSRDTSPILEQRYPWTQEQNAANAVCHCFAGAVAQAMRNGNKSFEKGSVLPKPVTVKAAQLIHGRLDLVIVQLNTLDLSGDLKKEDEGDVKNFVWLEKGLQFYKAKPHYENLTQVEHLDMDVANKFVGFLLYH